jgi:putative addiction module antidote
MEKRIAVRRAGGSIAVTLPKHVLERLGVAAGHHLFVVETEQGVLLTPYDPNVERAMQIYEGGAKQYRNALHELAK